MSAASTFLWLAIIHACLTTGDVLAKRAVVGPDRDLRLSAAALLVWIAGCFACLPLMRARGFTRLIALADATGLVIIAAAGFLFLGERLTARELAGIGAALTAIVLLMGGSK